MEYDYAELVITVDDIISFNITSREIIFADVIFEKLTTLIDECIYNQVTLYYGDMLLFESIPVTTRYSSTSRVDLVLIFNEARILPEFSFILADGYPENLKEYWYREVCHNAQKEREENAAKRKTQWDTFITYLTDSGKIID